MCAGRGGAARSGRTQIAGQGLRRRRAHARRTGVPGWRRGRCADVEQPARTGGAGTARGAGAAPGGRDADAAGHRRPPAVLRPGAGRPRLAGGRAGSPRRSLRARGPAARAGARGRDRQRARADHVVDRRHGRAPGARGRLALRARGRRLGGPGADPTSAEVIARPARRPGRCARLVGLGHRVEDEDDPDWLARPDVRRGLATLAASGLAFDVAVRTRDLAATLAVARDLPELTVVLHHLARPPIASGDLATWGRALLALAELPNVVAKVSGLVTEAEWHTWSIDDLRHPVELAVDAFGAERLMLGSDWPRCLLAGSYGDAIDSVRYLVADLSAHEQAQIDGLTAARVYHLTASRVSRIGDGGSASDPGAGVGSSRPTTTPTARLGWSADGRSSWPTTSGPAATRPPCTTPRAACWPRGRSPTPPTSGAGGKAEQDPADWWRAFCQATRMLLGETGARPRGRGLRGHVRPDDGRRARRRPGRAAAAGHHLGRHAAARREPPAGRAHRRRAWLRPARTSPRRHLLPAQVDVAAPPRAGRPGRARPASSWPRTT